LGARKKEERERIPNMILAALSEDHVVTAKELKAKSICGTETLYKRLKELIASGEVWKDGKGYRRKSWPGPPEFAPLPKQLERYVHSEIKTLNDLFARIDLDFERAYFLYVRFLVRMMDPKVRIDAAIISATDARDIFDFFFTTQIKRPLASLAQLVWHKGGSLNIADVDPRAALALFRPKSYLKPKAAEQIAGLTIAELMALIRRENSPLDKKGTKS
jgi:hypothetical protein